MITLKLVFCYLILLGGLILNSFSVFANHNAIKFMSMLLSWGIIFSAIGLIIITVESSQ